MIVEGIYGKKIEMSQVFTKDGEAVPVTAIELCSCKVTQIKNEKTDGYNAVQIALGLVKKRPSSPIKGHFKKSGVTPTKTLRELTVKDLTDTKLGDEVKLDIFKEGEKVDVTGISKGKGFAGVIKRYNFSGGPATHGSRFHRTLGSVGSRKPKRVFKGKRMPGRMGGEKVTVQNLEVEKIIPDKNLILIKGAVPGARGGLIFIKKAVKG